MDAYLHTHYNIHSLQVLINADREPKVMEDFVSLGYSAKDLAAMSEEEFTKHIKILAKVRIIPHFFVFLHSLLTNVDSCHDSTNHASMLVLAAPRIFDTL